MKITLDQIKELRTRTGAGVTAVKQALEESKGDTEKAIASLREKGIAKAAKRADKRANNGFIAHYIHGNGSMGVLLELNSETDFAARSEEFQELARELAVHVAAMDPEYIAIEHVPPEVIEKEVEIAKKSVDKGKPDEVVNKIVEGKLEKFYKEVVLLEQAYVKDDSKQVKDLLNEALAAIGEKIEVGRFCRFKIAGSATACNL
ncbi:MAG: translation elongation factor Ts [Candidatus Dojkabacteria bacterium]